VATGNTLEIMGVVAGLATPVFGIKIFVRRFTFFIAHGSSLSVNLLCRSLRLLKSKRLAFSLAFSPAALLIAVRSILASGAVNRTLNSRLGCCRSIIMVFPLYSHLYRASKPTLVEVQTPFLGLILSTMAA
jgi:hypothetical protein